MKGGRRPLKGWRRASPNKEGITDLSDGRKVPVSGPGQRPAV